MRRFAIILVLILTALPCLAQSGLTRIEGNVDQVDTNNGILTINSQGGWQRVWVQNATTIEQDGNRVGLWQLRPGDRVVVEGIPMNDGRILAASVRVRRGGGGGTGGGGTGGGSGTLTSMYPAPGSTVTTARPTVTATFSDSVDRARIWIDEAEFTGQARLSGNTLSWTPEYNLDNGQHKVRVEGYGLFGVGYKGNWTFNIQPQQEAAQVINYAPAPGSYVTVPRPTISGEFSVPVRRRSIRFYVDGRDFTSQARISGTRVTWYPGYNLDYGEHKVRLEAVTERGQDVRGNWNFVISR